MISPDFMTCMADHCRCLRPGVRPDPVAAV